MLTHPNFDPVALSIGPFDVFGSSLGPVNVHWYGLMYLLAFTAAWILGRRRATSPGSLLTPEQVEDLVFYGALGIVLGARIGYIFFYNFGAFLDNPIMLFKVWEGGMSFHGGLLGVIFAMVLYSRKVSKNFIDIMDFVAPLVPLGLGFGRIGNFINGELWGRTTDLPWGMVFSKDLLQAARHPSQLYQSFLEGFVLFAVLYWFSAKPRPRAAVSSLFLIGYGIFRFSVEFMREPDAHIGYTFGWMTRGQILSLPMIIIGLFVFYMAYTVKKSNEKISTEKISKKNNRKKAK
ncbi:MAG: phosphatidylglycerol:prolipoprotein diacylglycerol transferase [Lentisphaeria bacterium]|jgi:phosphatidylglycerol:prolipoprotein diacylglycerol transferase